MSGFTQESTPISDFIKEIVPYSSQNWELGAGVFQIIENGWNPEAIGTLETYFDQYFDHWMVAFGGWLYDQYGDEFGYLIPEQLQQAYLQYEQEHGDPGSP